jgi:hypothetical protein
MGAAVAAVIIRKEKDLVEHFRGARALTPSTARTAADLGVHPDVAWRILVHRGIVREGSPGMYYLDDQAWEAHRRNRRRLALIVLALAVAVAVTVSLMTASHIR